MNNEDIAALGYFNAMSPNLPLRQKIALAMLAKSRKSPQNLGEGIASVGQSFADAIMQRSLIDEDRAAMQQAATATVPPIADSAVPPTPPPQASAIPDNRPNIVPPQPPQARVIAPPTPLPPDQQQTYEPGAPTRMPGRPGPPPVIPPGQPGNNGQDTFLSPAAAAPPAVPVMAQGGTPADVPPAEENRRVIGQALLRQQMGGAPPPAPAAPPRPSVADFGQPSALAPTPPPQAIPAAPPQQPIRAIPPQGPQQPEPIAGYVPPQPDDPQGAPTIKPGPREQQLRAFMLANSGNPHMANSQPAQELKTLENERERQQKEADKLWEAKVTRGNEQSKLNLVGRMDQPKRIQDIETGALEQEKKRLEIEDAREKSILQSRFGGRDPEKVFASFDTEKESAKGAVHALTQFTAAKDLIEKGVIVGTGQGWKVSAAKVAGMLGSNDAAGAVARTEEMQAAIKSTLRIAIENIQGAGGKVSDTDVAIASGTIGADPALQLDTIKNLVNRGEQAAKSKLNSYNEQVDTYLGGTRAEKRYRVQIPGSEAKTEEPKPKAADPLEGREALLPDKTIVVRRGGKWVPK